MHGLGPRSVILGGREDKRDIEITGEREGEGVTSSRPNDCCTLNFSVLLHQGRSKKLEHRLSDSISRDIKNSSPALLSTSQMCAEE